MPPNALIHEASPYLRQHAHNPVRWRPWSEAAFETAEREQKPIFLSIGYSACHWCHVMERESFEDEAMAEFLNRHFVTIKVDREERPDIDHHYLQAVQSMTGQGGWPLSVFLTPDKKPFYGGTYWPPYAKWGRPGFHDVLKSVAHAWAQQRDAIVAGAAEIHEHLARTSSQWIGEGEIRADLLDRAAAAAVERFDAVHGGFGQPPKFLHAMELSFLLRRAVRTTDSSVLPIVRTTLTKMAHGGIYDQLGGGFHRYSTDARWLVPHFEKMLYDNALLIPVYLDTWLLTRDETFRRTAIETTEWALREMAIDDGGFASSLDADSDGEEGQYYVWKPEDVLAALGPERGERFCRVYDVTETGNFEGKASILNLPEPLTRWAERFSMSLTDLERELQRDRAELLAVREGRVRPARDDKVLTDWCGLMISALARGFATIGDPRYLAAAERTADRLLRPFAERGRLAHAQLGEQEQSVQLLLDYAALANGLLDLYLVSGNARWFSGCAALMRAADERFGRGGLYGMAEEGVAETLAVDPFDGAVPSGLSLAGNVLVRLYHLTGDSWYGERAVDQVKPLVDTMPRAPHVFSQAMRTVEDILCPPELLVLVGDRERELWDVARTFFAPHRLTLRMPDNGEEPAVELHKLLVGKIPVDGKPTGYLCRDFVCETPATSAEMLRDQLKSAGRRNAALTVAEDGDGGS